MKKFIALAVALVSFGAMAQDKKHMVTLSGYEHDTEARSLDLNYGKNDEKDAEKKTQNIALNYAYAVAPAWQVGAKFKNFKETTEGDVVSAGDEYTTYGLFVTYNFAGKLTDTNYLTLGYDMTEVEDAKGAKDGWDEDTIYLEFGHRFSLGTLWGMNFNWSPSVALSQTKEKFNDSNEKDIKTTQFALNVLKVDVLF